MSYTRWQQNWLNGSTNSTNTPVNMGALNHVEAGIVDIDTRLTTVETNYFSKTLIGAKGSMLIGSAAGVIGSLPVGADTQVLTLDSVNVNGLGMKWATPASGGSSGIPLSTVTTAGDLIIAMANATVVRLAKGDDGQILKSDSGFSPPVLWEDPNIPVYSQGLLIGPGRLSLDLIGSGVFVADDSVNQRTKIIIQGSKTAFGAESHNLASWSFDIANAIGASSPSNGTIYLTKILVPPGTVSISKINWVVVSASVTATSGANWISLYNPNGNRLVTPVSADTDSATVGLKTSSFSVTDISNLSFVWVAFVFAATNMPTISRSNVTASPVAINVGLTASLYRYAINGSGTTLPISVTPSSNVAGSICWWVAIS